MCRAHDQMFATIERRRARRADTPEGGTMRLMKKEKGDGSGAEPEKSDSNAGPVSASQSRPTESESRTDPTVPSPAGWYPDPHNRGVARYWDGATWAERTQPLPAPPPAPPNEKPSGAMGA